MPIYVSGFKADHSSIGEFLRSNQLRDAVRQGAQDVATTANRTKVTSKLEYWVENGPDVIVTKNGNPRLSERVRCDHPAAAAIEFGSGSKSWRGGDHKRPQGGGNEPYRTLGKAGAAHADRIGSTDD